MDKAVDHLSSKCPESDVLDLRRDADGVRAQRADVTASLEQLVARTTEAEAAEVAFIVNRLNDNYRLSDYQIKPS